MDLAKQIEEDFPKLMQSSLASGIEDISNRSKESSESRWYFHPSDDFEDDDDQHGEICFTPSGPELEELQAIADYFGGTNIRGAVCEEIKRRDWDKINAAFEDRKLLLEIVPDLFKIAHRIGSIFFHGDMVIETPSERELCKLLDQYGFLYKSEDEVINSPFHYEF